VATYVRIKASSERRYESTREIRYTYTVRKITV